ncbi:ATP-citrate synthase-like isoform X1 [Lineus longissimus]|uniref:ATP-citrate synthase-like isoform X1 n=1 Tax=Lineus longissimus TaxID=88925 RepID=UPI002B4E44AC
MSAKAVWEITAKDLFNKYLGHPDTIQNKSAEVKEDTQFENLSLEHPWLLAEKLIVKPDQLIKRRGKLGLIKVNADYAEVKEWLKGKLGLDFKIGVSTGKLKHFIIEPFVAHQQEEEFYACIYSSRDSDTILFHHEGGVDVGDVDAKAVKMEIPVGSDEVTAADIKAKLLGQAPDDKKEVLSTFIEALYKLFVDLHFTYLEINPLVVTKGKVHILDVAAKIDQCGEYLCKQKWGEIEFPPPFGREAYPEEAYIADLDAKSGASLKLTVLNPRGRIWTMVAGGGASVIYADTICDMGGAAELANYGEYSGAPSEQQTYEYAKTVLGLMTKIKRGEAHNIDPVTNISEYVKRGKVLIIGGGIANFTNVAATFKGIVRALKEFKDKLIDHQVSIFVRRGGPNYQEGLRVMSELGENLGVPIHVYGPETHMTAIVGMALGKRLVLPKPEATQTTANFLLSGATAAAGAGSRKNSELEPTSPSRKISSNNSAATPASGDSTSSSNPNKTFTNRTRCIIWGMQPRAVQSMMDFDHVCRRKEPSVACMIYPFTGDHKQKFYWGHKEILLPVYKNMDDAMKKHPDADVLISFASLRSAYESTLEVMTYPQIKTIAIIAEGIPENLTRKINKLAVDKGICIIGPATVGGIKPGCFKIGNTGGMMDNILASKLYRPGSIAYVSRSGGMSNELNNIIALNANGVYEGVAIGGDRYPGTTFMDHMVRYHDDPAVKMIVLLGEVGGTEEYKIIEAIKSGRLHKPLVAWCIGTCAKMFTSEVQFGHAGSCANADAETATAKNVALKEVGAHVPDNFDELGDVIKQVYDKLLEEGVVVLQEEIPPPAVPMDYNWARELGIIRKPASFMTSICDERGQELLYAGMPITEVFKEDMGIGGVLSLLWFQRRLPKWACKFIEMCLMITADHGPAVSGAHNTIVCARAGKDLISCLASGLLTIGERFGGALDDAARQFSEAYDSNQIPMEFVNSMRKKGQLIMGIGHRVKSINNPDMRVEILKKFASENFPSTPLLNYAYEVEKITTSKRPNLILNVDGFIGVAMVDLLRICGCFTTEEAREFVEVGALNALFVLGRSMGFIGHYLDQKRLKQGLYRHPWDDISYVLPEVYGGQNTE